jgi:hypothetical protein
MAFFPSLNSSQELTISVNTKLDYPYSQNPNAIVVTDIIDVIATTVNLGLILPDATKTTNGFAITFNNVGTNPFNILLNNNLTLYSVLPGNIVTVYLYDNNNVNGLWRVIPFGGGTNGISSLTINSSDESIIVTGSPVSPPSGSVTISLPDIVSSVQTLTGSTGIVTVTEGHDPIWGTLNLSSSNNNINIDNGTFTLNENLNLTQITSGNIVINNSTITNTNTNGTLTITSNGANSNVNLNKLTVDTLGNVNIPGTCTITGQLIAPSAPAAWCRFTMASGTVALLANINVSSVTYNSTNFQYTINFTHPLNTIDYLVMINCSNLGSSPPIQTKMGYDIIRQSGSVTIILTDAAGEMLLDIPEGVSIIIYSN